MALTKVPSNLDATIATTQSASDNSTNVATTAYVTTALANLVDSSPSALNTLNELAAALNDDASFSTTVNNSIATKLPLAGGTLTGTLNIANAGSPAALSFGANIPSSGQTILTYHSGNTRSGLGIVSGVHRMFTDASATISFGGISQSDGSTYTERMQIDANSNLKVTNGNILIDAASGNPYLSIKTAGTGNNPYTEYRAGNNTVFDTMGVFSATTDRFRIGYGASGTVDTEILSVLSGGQVGINKDSPNAHSTLHLANGPYCFITLEATHSGGRGYEIFSLASDSSFHVYDRTLAKYRMTIDGTGEVGIGTTTPTENLHVSSTETGDHTRIHIEKTSTAGTAGLSMKSTSAAHTWTIFQDDDSEGILNLYSSAAAKYPLRLTKDGSVGINAVPMAWYAGQSMLQLGAQMTVHSEIASAASNSAHMSLNAQLDTDGSWEYIVSNQATNYYQYEGGHYWRVTTSGTAGNDISWSTPLAIQPTSGVISIRPVGYSNAPKNHAALNIGRLGAGETRAIDIWGSWSANENKSISFNHGTSGTNMVGQINCMHSGTSSSLRWGKLYHNGDSSAYTMELKSVSLTAAKLIINNSNVVGDAPINVKAGLASTGCFVGRSQNYIHPYGLLPWSGICYISSGGSYSGGVWDYSQSTDANQGLALLGWNASTGIRWYAGDTSGGGASHSWQYASNVQLFNSAGQLTAATASDRRLKENITNMNSSDALTKVKALQGVSFEWNDTIKAKRGAAYPEGTQYGFIAQDVKEVWPDAHTISDNDVYEEDNATLTMDENDTYYGDIEGVRQEKLIPLLVESIKAQQAMIETLQAEVAELKGT